MTSVLHLIQNNFNERSILKTLQESILPIDQVVFLQEGVYLTQMLTAQEHYFLEKINCQQLFVIESDLLARGLGHLKITHIKTIDYPEFIQLLIDFPHVQQWAN